MVVYFIFTLICLKFSDLSIEKKVTKTTACCCENCALHKICKVAQDSKAKMLSDSLTLGTKGIQRIARQAKVNQNNFPKTFVCNLLVQF